jgi:hypothetical protein
LILGYDASCGKCQRIASRVTGGDAEGRIRVMSLADPRMIEWRRQLLDVDAPWQPLLIETSSRGTTAYTGWRLAVQMTRRLGVRRSLRLLEAIGESESVRGSDDAVRFSRSTFFKASIGATAALAFLTTGTANAAGRRAAPLPGITSTTHLKGAALQTTVERLVGSRDFLNVVSPQLYNEFKRVERVVSEPAELGQLAYRAATHQLSDNTVLTTLALHDEEYLTIAYEHRPPGAASPMYSATEYTVDGNTLTATRRSINGVYERPAQATDLLPAGVEPCGGCGKAPGDRGEKLCNACLEFDMTCLASSCGGCAFAGDPLRIVACVATLCVWLGATCCRREGMVCQNCPAFSTVCPTARG